MKHINSPKKPTLQQKKFITKHHLVSENWLVVNDANDYMWIKNKRTGRLKKLVKEGEKE